MNERDDDPLKRYRELPREAPPAALDASILAASRRATRRPLSRWAAPFSVAAVLVLALALVLRVQREAPEATLPSVQERAVPGTSAPAASTVESAEKDVQAPKVETAQVPEAHTAAAPKLRKSEGPPHAQARDSRRERAAPEAKRQDLRVTPFAPEPPAAASDAAGRVAAAPAAAAAKEAASTEERELERIAHLRAEGKDDEADAALEAFRRAHPDYRIEPAMWEKVRRR